MYHSSPFYWAADFNKKNKVKNENKQTKNTTTDNVIFYCYYHFSPDL